MTNDEAIIVLKNIAWFGKIYDQEQTEEAVDMAINALTKEAWKEEHPVSPLLQKPATTAQPETHEKRTKTHSCDCIERKAVEHLDRFAKLYCRDKSITDDLAFRCGKCKFEMPDKTCLVKVMARKLCPEYKDFGAMGDL